MNLIEKLGGYEKAKLELQLKIDGSAFQCCMSVTADMIKEALLEHRRENNIFEVGDFVIDPQHTGLLKVTRVMKKRLDVDYLNPQTLDVICHHSILIRFVRHATPKEIKAGHRL